MPLRADGSPVWPFRSPGLRIAAHAHLPKAFRFSGACRTEAPRSQLRDSSGFAPDSLGGRWKSYPVVAHGLGAPEVGGRRNFNGAPPGRGPRGGRVDVQGASDCARLSDADVLNLGIAAVAAEWIGIAFSLPGRHFRQRLKHAGLRRAAGTNGALQAPPSRVRGPCRPRNLGHHRGLEQSLGENADFATGPLLWDRPFAPKDRLRSRSGRLTWRRRLATSCPRASNSRSRSASA